MKADEKFTQLMHQISIVVKARLKFSHDSELLLAESRVLRILANEYCLCIMDEINGESL